MNFAYQPMYATISLVSPLPHSNHYSVVFYDVECTHEYFQGMFPTAQVKTRRIILYFVLSSTK
jgi:hypothetical protein